MREQLHLLLSDRKPALYLFRRAVLIVLEVESGLERSSRDWGAILALAIGAGYDAERIAARSRYSDSALAAPAPIAKANLSGYDCKQPRRRQ